MYCGDDVEAVVGDVGTSSSKFGMAGEDTPKVVVASAVGRKTDRAGQFQSIVGDFYHATQTEVVEPMEHGVVKDWDAMEQLWTHAFANLHVDAAEHPVIASMPTCVATSEWTTTMAQHIEQYMTLLFETFDVPCLYFAKDAVVDAFAFGRSSALIVEIGASATRVVPIVDGFALHRPAEWSSIGCNRLSTYLQTLVCKRHPNLDVYPRCCFTRTVSSSGKLETTLVPADVLQATFPASFQAYMRREIFRDMREVVAITAPTALKKDGASSLATSALEEQRYELPDGHMLTLQEERYRVVEYLLDPTALDPELASATSDTSVKGLPNLIYEAVQLCDADLRRDMLSNIILCGGGSLTRGLTERLQADLASMVPSSFKVRFLSAPKIERQFSCFIGQSILASLGSFQQLWVSRREFDEFGANKLCQDRFL